MNEMRRLMEAVDQLYNTYNHIDVEELERRINEFDLTDLERRIIDLYFGIGDELDRPANMFQMRDILQMRPPKINRIFFTAMRERVVPYLENIER